MDDRNITDKTELSSPTIKQRRIDKQVKANKLGGYSLWLMIMLMYTFLFSGIGYIAFWEQDFNNPDKFLMKYELLREKHFDNIKKTYGQLDSINGDSEFNENINDYMKNANDSAGDLQELASQSFNIVLGALLAFLSATTSILFQANTPKGKKKDNEASKVD